MDTILVVDDEKNYLVVMSALLGDQGYEVLTAEDGQRALSLLEDCELDLVLTDMMMPGMDGIELTGRIQEREPGLPVIVMTAFGSVERAVTAMKAGAYDYITKPFQNDELMLTIRKALDMRQLKRRNQELTNQLTQRHSFANIIGKSTAMQEVFNLVRKVADTQANVLITGESGTGKELIARAIHTGNQKRREKPFVSVNCAALPENLLESELFGHEKGAFTGAVSTRKGRFELSHGGTLFLDEIGEMPISLQAKLLRAIQEREFERVGGTRTIKVDVRLVAASNRDLKKEAQEKRFREDLLYRLNVLEIHLPPLRQRADDLPLLVSHFLRLYAQKEGAPEKRLSPEAMRLIYAHHWPGNVRELENAIERALITSGGPLIEPGDLPGDLARPSPAPAAAGGLSLEETLARGLGLNETLEMIEREMLIQAMKRADHVQAHAAGLLGIKKNVMQYKLKKYDLI